MELLTAAQMREIEQAAIASGAVTGLELMERAGRGVVEAIWDEWPELRAISGRAVVLCGPGNNGGDGFVVARLLKEWGWEVEVFLYGDPEKLPPDARVNYDRWGELGEVRPLDDYAVPLEPVENNSCKLVVDAMFGIGLARPFEEKTWFWGTIHMSAANSAASGLGPKVVAIDVASRICSDSGRVLDSGKLNHTALTANFAVTFHRPKLGHYIGQGACAHAAVRTVDIGLGGLEEPDSVENVRVVGCDPLVLGKQPADHKYRNGHSLVLSGGVARGGAARLAARGALRIGAGLVTVGCPPSALIENAQALDAIMVRRIEGGAALAAMLEEDARINALCLGPGMGTGARGAGLVEAALTVRGELAPNLCLDADALTLLAKDAALFGKLHKGCVLTPHAGEFARLFPDIAERLAALATKGPAYSKVDATREAAKRAGCVVLFKGPDTVIADPSGRCSINAAVYDRAAPWLATAGSGDVLAGFITGLLARGFSPMQAAETGAWLHVECARSFGPGLIAEDLPEELPKVFRALGL